MGFQILGQCEGTKYPILNLSLVRETVDLSRQQWLRIAVYSLKEQVNNQTKNKQYPAMSVYICKQPGKIEAFLSAVSCSTQERGSFKENDSRDLTDVHTGMTIECRVVYWEITAASKKTWYFKHPSPTWVFFFPKTQILSPKDLEREKLPCASLSLILH